MRRLIAAVAALAASVVLLTGCQSGLSETGEPLTIEQSEVLAQTRFQVASRGEVALEISVLPADDIDHLAFDVTLDPEGAAAWGTMSRGPEDLAVDEAVAFTPEAFASLSNGQWQAVSFAEGPSAALAVIFSLGADRPENAQLLRQSDATYLGTVDVDGEQQQVFRLPSVDGEGGASTRMWLDEDGRLQRLDAGDDDTLVVLLTDAEPQARPDGLDSFFGTGTDG